MSPGVAGERTVTAVAVRGNLGCLTVRPAPDSEPPLDGPIGLPISNRGGQVIDLFDRGRQLRGDGQAALALDFGTTSRSPAPAIHPPLRVVSAAGPAGAARVGQVSDPSRWAATLAQAVVETVSGQRPVTQLVRWTDERVYKDLVRRSRAVQRVRPTTRGGQRTTPQVMSIHLCEPAAGVVEAAAHVRHGARSRALAMRLETVEGHWLCTALEMA